MIASKAVAFNDPNCIVVTDAKGLYDNLYSEQAAGDDDRAALEVAIIKESLASIRGRPRWVQHSRDPSDALTKVADAHCEPLLKMLQTHTFSIEEEFAVLERGKQSENRIKSSLGSERNNKFWGCRTYLEALDMFIPFRCS